MALIYFLPLSVNVLARGVYGNCVIGGCVCGVCGRVWVWGVYVWVCVWVGGVVGVCVRDVYGEGVDVWGFV